MNSYLDKIGVVKDITGAEQGVSNIEVMCRLCFNGEHEGSEKERKMLTCKSCDKKYHMSCLKAWAQNRDLFHWSSWTCPSCRTCEVCRRTGDPNKFMFCKRCDGAYHCYCQHPSYKNVSHGPYLCPKHTRCHSCGSNVPGNGRGVRWLLGYTCCHACGGLFVKGNYCPVCLRVYRDSEVTPMVCCDNCQRWVHCQCDGISDERYLQYQVNNNLEYKCAICRGECYQVRDLEDAVQELWKRRDIFDRDLIANLRAAAGLPTQDEISPISPRDTEAERVSSVANCERLLQEKELMERQNILLNDELTKKFKSFNELCQAHNEFEADMSSKLADAEQYNPSLCALEWKQDRVKDPESQLTSLQELNASFDQRLSEIAPLQAVKRQTYSQLIEKDGEFKRLNKSKRQLLELLEQKNIEISKKVVTMNSYLDKIVNTDNAATRKAKLFDPESQLSNSGEFNALQSQHEQLNTSFDQRLSEIAQLQVEMRQTYSQLIEKAGDIERLIKSKRQLLELLEQKDIEISGKIVMMKSYLDKIDELTRITFAEVSRKRKYSQISTANDLVNSTNNAPTRKAKPCDVEAELERSVANYAHLLQVSPLLDPGAVFDQMIARLLQMKAICYHGKGLLVEGPKVPTGRVVHCLDMPFRFLAANLKKPRSNLTTRSNQDWRLAN